MSNELEAKRAELRRLIETVKVRLSARPRLGFAPKRLDELKNELQDLQAKLYATYPNGVYTNEAWRKVRS